MLLAWISFLTILNKIVKQGDKQMGCGCGGKKNGRRVSRLGTYSPRTTPRTSGQNPNFGFLSPLSTNNPPSSGARNTESARRRIERQRRDSIRKTFGH